MAGTIDILGAQAGIDRVRALLLAQSASGIALQMPEAPTLHLVPGYNAWSDFLPIGGGPPEIHLGARTISTDVAAHEFVHLVIDANTHFTTEQAMPSGDFRAIHEGLADTFAALAAHHWKLDGRGGPARDIARGAGIITSLHAHTLHGRPPTSHQQGGVVSRVAYLMSKTWDTDTVARIFARVISTGLTPTMHFADLGAALLQSAKLESPLVAVEMRAALVEVGYSLPPAS